MPLQLWHPILSSLRVRSDVDAQSELIIKLKNMTRLYNRHRHEIRHLKRAIHDSVDSYQVL